MKTIKVNISNAFGAISEGTVSGMLPEASEALSKVENGTGAGNDFLGWVKLPSETTPALVDDIVATAERLRSECEYVVCVGIGGSYLGAKAVIEALGDSFAPYRCDCGSTKVVFAGQNIGEDYMYELLQLLDGKKFGIVVISKSGTTTEPAIAFRLLKEKLEKQVGKKKAAELTVAITDAKRGALRQLATEEGYKTFVIADNVGGRFSVLTPVGLLPIAVAGYDIRALLHGAAEMEEATKATTLENPSLLYAATRNALYRAGKKTEILANFNPKLHYFGEWWKQLYGESEGKDGKGIFPASVTLTADLHSMGQYIQDGERTLFETVISVAAPAHEVKIESDAENLDGLNYLAGKRISEVNRMAELGVQLAHVDGGVPNIRIELPRIDAYTVGALLYFFEKACGISGYLLGVNPFDQPGVEAYKKNMFALLEKPGYEEATKAIRERL